MIRILIIRKLKVHSCEFGQEVAFLYTSLCLPSYPIVSTFYISFKVDFTFKVEKSSQVGMSNSTGKSPTGVYNKIKFLSHTKHVNCDMFMS